MSFKIALLGSIPKGDDERKNWSDWKMKYRKCLSQIDDVKFTDGDVWKDESKPTLVVGHDLSLIKESDLVVVNAESKIGAGTAQEIIVAKYFHKPVITVIPKNSHHRKSDITFNNQLIKDWVHPFLLTSSDLIVGSIEDSISWIKEYQQKPKTKTVKDISFIDNAISEFKNHKADSA